MGATPVEDAAFAIGELLSENLALSPEGYLIARAVVVARTATVKPQQYYGHELGIPNDDSIYDVWRSPEEVFHPTSLASGEGKVVTSPHPGSMLSPENTSWYSKGVAMNFRRGGALPGGETALLADLVLTDHALIEQVQSGNLREVSLGYQCQYWPRGDGSFEQRNILVNHVAIVPKARGGHTVAIKDSIREESTMKENESNSGILERLQSITDMLEQFLERRASKETQQPQRRTLADGCNDIVRRSRRTEELRDSGASFTDFMRENNAAYREHDDAHEAGEDFARKAKDAGAAMQQRFTPKSVRCADSIVPVDTHRANDAEDWAATANRMGRKMRGR